MGIKTLTNWWEVWDIQVVTISSLLLQIALIFSAPLRKQLSKAIVVFPMWLAYLLADAIPIYAMGLIARRKSRDSKEGTANTSDDLMVFWAPFLLLHLGGPDTITAFALEDNELWHRHLLNLIVQSCVFLYAFFLSIRGNELWLPTVLVFIAGFIKYAERTCSLYLASARGLGDSMLEDPDPGPDYERHAEDYTSKLEAGIPTRRNLYTVRETDSTRSREVLSDFEAIQHARRFDATLKGLIADLRFSSHQRSENRSFFLARKPRDAFKIVEAELNFFYQILYTKILVVQGKYGLPLRISSFALSGAALALFKLMDKQRKGYKEFDVALTYTLLGGAIVLDTVSSLMIPFSDRFSVALCEPLDEYHNRKNVLKKILRVVLGVEKRRSLRESTQAPTETNQRIVEKPSAFSIGRIKHIVNRTWSESVSQFNLVDYCLQPRCCLVRRAVALMGLPNIFDSHKFVKSKKFDLELKDLIFDDLEKKSGDAKDLDTARKFSSFRGDGVLRSADCTSLLRWIENVEYDESILLWHIATELLYRTDNASPSSDIGGDSQKRKTDFKAWSKLLSDYMLYLLIMQTTIMSTVAGIGKIRFRDTCAEVKRCFRRENIRKMGEKKLHLKACLSIITVDTSVEPAAIKGDRSKSVLFDACRLAKKLKKLGEDEDGEVRVDKWRLICRVWIEMMCYAACHCKGTNHAAQLSKGGQLITLVWLLMAHLGLGDYFLTSPSISVN